jgi:excisionase family DNA binding protein
MSAADEYLTVEEAAVRLRVSAATARRMAKDGRLGARKSGRQWLIDAAALPQASPRRRRRSPGTTVDLERALEHVRATDLKQDLWVPDILQYEDVLADAAGLLARAAAVFDQTGPGPSRVVEIDRSLMLTRPGSLLALHDRVAYQAAVAAFAGRVDALMADCIFSSRLSDSPRFFTRHPTRQWVTWRRFVRAQLADASDPWLVKTDLTAYFETVPHRGLLADIEALNVDAAVLNVMRDVLKSWGGDHGLGLPQGPNASRILGNLYLAPVDRAMLGQLEILTLHGRHPHRR